MIVFPAAGSQQKQIRCELYVCIGITTLIVSQPILSVN